MKKYLLILALIATLIPLTAAAAKGRFAYITIRGPYLNGNVSSSAPVLVDEFNAFADFSQGPVPAPADPGDGYDILRFVTTSKKTVEVFDQLHYYPDTGYVYYDGLASGSSEYDRQWFLADPDVEAPFRNVLVQQTRMMWGALALLLIGLAVFAYFYYGKRAAGQK